MKAPAHHGVRAKHASHKHAAKSKHTAKTAHKPARKTTAPKAGVGTVATHAKARKLTPDSLVALCSARAVAESLRLSLGVVASDDDVLDLYFRSADDPDEGASILAALHAAAAYGLAGCRPLGVAGVAPVSRAAEGRPALPADVRQGCHYASVVLGLDLPEGDHAVLATPDGWWSWGELHDPSRFPGAVIAEAWAVTWS